MLVKKKSWKGGLGRMEQYINQNLENDKPQKCQFHRTLKKFNRYNHKRDTDTSYYIFLKNVKRINWFFLVDKEFNFYRGSLVGKKFPLLSSRVASSWAQFTIGADISDKSFVPWMTGFALYCLPYVLFFGVIGRKNKNSS